MPYAILYRIISSLNYNGVLIPNTKLIQKIQGIRKTNTLKYKNLSDEELNKAVQSWINRENQKKGYLPGLSPKKNITSITEISERCVKCQNPKVTCPLINVFKNLAAVNILVEIIENNEELKIDAKKIIHDQYKIFLMLKEYVSRNCKGKWF